MAKGRKIGAIASICGIALCASVVIAGNAVCGVFAPMITTALCGTGVSFDNEDFKEISKQSDALCEEVAREGITLVRNEKNALPLKSKKVNVFGWSATDNGFLLSGIGSGSSTINPKKKVTFLEGLKAGGFEYNQDIIDMYKNYDNNNYGYSGKRIPLVEPGIKKYSRQLFESATEFSDTALVVISRIAGENVGEIPMVQKKSHGQPTDNSRHYLEISTEEEALIKRCKEEFNKVVVIINSTNPMELGFLEELDVDACLNVGIMGQSGARAIPYILDGRVTPSGRLTDTYAYDFKKDPTYHNYVRNGDHVSYIEDIYFGYKWYETADVEGYFDNVENEYGKGYEGVVQYPFGHGLSYTDFEWKLEDTTLEDNSEIKKDDEITLTFSCTNVGDVKGSDVLEVYYTPAYTKGEVEKSSINLLDFEKTVTLEPGQTQKNIKISFTPYELASYDAYDKNNNKKATWEVDDGNYEIKFMNNAHEFKKMVKDGEKETPNKLTYKVSKDIIYDKDPTSGHEVKNVFTGEDAIAGVPIDGSTLFNDKKDAPNYLSREDFEGTMPKNRQKNPTNNQVGVANSWMNDEFKDEKMPICNAKNNLYIKTKMDGSKPNLADLNGSGAQTKYNDELLFEIGKDYNSTKLTQLVDELSADEACRIVEDSGFGTPAIESIGKARSYDFDGPAGFNANTQTGFSSGEWTAFPNQVLIGQTWSKYIAKQIGLTMGAEGQTTNLQGWYAPVVNLHRSPFNGRNYEMYSEDAILSGKLAAHTIVGAKANGVYAYLKHFGLTEPGNNSRNLNTWLTEQNLRENYFKAFEIAVKEGETVAIMTSFSSIGGVWSGANSGSNRKILRDEWGFNGSLITDWSNGGGNMNCHAGVRGGNDIWLNPVIGGSASKLNRNSAEEVYLAKQAARNVIYTFASTYNYAKHYDASEDDLKVEIGTNQIKPPFAWWTILLGGIDVLAVAGLACWTYFGVIKAFKKSKKVEE